MSRQAPETSGHAASRLKVFGIGFPIAASFNIIGLALPCLAMPLNLLFQETIGMIRQIMTVSLPTR